jgi:hypothetical protein
MEKRYLKSTQWSKLIHWFQEQGTGVSDMTVPQIVAKLNCKSETDGKTPLRFRVTEYAVREVCAMNGVRLKGEA